MNRPPQLYQRDSAIAPESWAQFLNWLAKEKPLIASAFAGKMLETTDDKYKLLLESSVNELLDTERLLEAERATVRELSGKLGEFVDGGTEVKFQRVAEITSKATGGKYAVGILALGNRPCVVSGISNRVFVLPWERLARLAIAEGVDQSESKLIIPGR